MNAMPPPASFDIQHLVDAIAQARVDDPLLLQLTPAQWLALAPYLQPLALSPGQILFKQGAADRTLYLIESGNLSVHYEDEQGEVRLAIVGAGSAVGEGSFFSRAPRSATVQAGMPARLWNLSPMRFHELSNRQPELALAVAMAAGSVVAKRLTNRRRRDAVT
ncbi:Crp/Fnr family transcriptional regulator [Pseudorhodoferax sp. Leaf267]|uniref:Crp/Fnr family transcriptional regulator n=1 Tax=Pseudorhodoferax sp. Leaf267 TaxID=1736316 RepID=UPI0006FB7C32|nr:cyclic nucleotide-binding domain-containing protein [Pseudorhodoferax sp. Leaf267]KQP21600.1 Crp/Fnr family transcriptional regulator [Pseudorhodoferax sp. Leaf267]